MPPRYGRVTTLQELRERERFRFNAEILTGNFPPPPDRAAPASPEGRKGELVIGAFPIGSALVMPSARPKPPRRRGRRQTQLSLDLPPGKADD